MRFVVADSSKNSRRPLIYILTENHIRQGLVGFTNNGRYYRGVNELMESVRWSSENNMWNVDPVNYKNNGRVDLQEFK